MAPPEPYLRGEVRDVFDRWLEATLARFSPPLAFAEIRKGVRALSALYVEKRETDRALEGRGKRAAFATYYAALHFLATWHALAEEAPAERVIDLGCGSGAAGAAAAFALGRPRLVGIDRSGWALSEARRTWAAFGLAGRVRRGLLPAALPRAGRGDLLLLAWAANELADAEPLRGALAQGLERGARVAVLEPLAGRAVPWWRDWERSLAGARTRELRRPILRPAWIARMDRAAGLDHAVLGARVLLA